MFIIIFSFQNILKNLKKDYKIWKMIEYFANGTKNQMKY